MLLRSERELVVEYGKKLLDTGLVTGTFGNISVYNPDKKLMAISPSGMDYYKTDAEDVAVLTPEGEQVDGSARPSSEYDMHRVFYLHRPDVRAVVHTHSPFATTLACMNWTVPAVHYAVGYAGKEIPCAPYAPFGTWELAQLAEKTVGDGYACLLGNHGMLAVGESLSYAFDAAQQVEFVCEMYYRCRSIGEPVILPDEQIESVMRVMHSYRKR